MREQPYSPEYKNEAARQLLLQAVIQGCIDRLKSQLKAAIELSSSERAANDPL